MKKKFFVSAFLALSVFALTEFITSCSSDFEEEVIDISSIQQRERIEKMAMEYGLIVDLKKALTTRTNEIQISEIENEFKKMSSLIGRYDIMNKGEGDSIQLESFNQMFLVPTSMPSESTESGSATLSSVELLSGRENGQVVYYSISINVDIKWEIANQNVATIDSVKVMENEFEISKTISDKHIRITGKSPGTIIFSFFLQLKGDFAEYSFSVIGTYNIEGGSGSLSVISASAGQGQNIDMEEVLNYMGDASTYS